MLLLGVFIVFSASCTATRGSLQERIRFLVALVELLAGDLPEDVQPVVKDALTFAYAARGYTDEGDCSERVPPCLGDVLVALELLALRAAGSRRAALEAIVHRLDRYARGDALSRRIGTCAASGWSPRWLCPPGADRTRWPPRPTSGPARGRSRTVSSSLGWLRR